MSHMCENQFYPFYRVLFNSRLSGKHLEKDGEGSKNINIKCTEKKSSAVVQLCTRNACLFTGLLSALACPVSAQTNDSSTSSALLEEVIVTSRKREESMQDAPLAVSAYGDRQIDALKVRDLENLAVGIPNVSLDDAGTAKGYANFSVRGLGINSSILSIDPSVGVFVDGVYMGIPAGMVFDVFDLEKIEVLRGPQGTLFGRNVTGGAIQMTTKLPGEAFEAVVKTAADGGGEGGLNYYAMASVGGPLSETFAAKLSAYVNQDDGWFKNQYTDDEFGEVDQQMVRAIGVWSPGANEIILRVEHDKNDSDGPAAQTHTNGSGVPGSFANFERDSFDMSIDEEGFYNTETDFVTLEYNRDVNFGEGSITNILGWRKFYAVSRGDIDSQPVWLFHSDTWTDAEQLSNELRYTGRFADRATLTTGLYYFTNSVDYHERRNLLGIANGGAAPAAVFDGGGYYDVNSWAMFATLDYETSDSFIWNFGLRYTYEEKEAEIASLSQNITNTPDGQTCNLVEPEPGEAKCEPDFIDEHDWSDVSPKLGFTYLLNEQQRVYSFLTRGFRSGGYNLRNTSFDPADVPGPFDEEIVDSFELGYKSESDRSRFNAALFYNKISQMQRELSFPGPIGVIQLIRNVADANIYGVEVEGTAALTEGLFVNYSVGLLDASYSDIQADLNRDGVIDEKDESLDLPRAPEVTYSLGFTHETAVGQWALLNSRIHYAYRDESAYTDDNLGYVLSLEMLDLGVDLRSADETWEVGIYGKNLLNDVKHGGDTQLPDDISGVPTGGTFAPLSKGRIYGMQFTYHFK
ncbi:Colicin I receptor [Thalassocella blandensis]|nr:Colicin I receptor [Thalassocella blandensis]